MSAGFGLFIILNGADICESGAPPNGRASSAYLEQRRTKMLRHLILVRRTLPVLALAMLPLTSHGGEFDLKYTEEVMTQLIERSMEERGVASASVALVKDDEIVWKAAFGYSNLRTNMHSNRFGGDYALGFWVEIDASNGHTIIQHGGAIAGQRSMLRGDVDAKVGIYYMTNSDVALPIDEPALALLRGDDYRLPPKRVGKKVSSKLLDEYAGTYKADVGVVLTFVRDGDELITKKRPIDLRIARGKQRSFLLRAILQRSHLRQE